MSNNTKAIIKAMLTENTGRDMCDSGGTPQYDENGKYVRSTSGYGRAFERNQGRDFDGEPQVTVKADAKHNEVEVKTSLYHYLVEKLTYNQDLDLLFGVFCAMYEQLAPEDAPYVGYDNQVREFVRFLNLSKTEGESKNGYHRVKWSDKVADIIQAAEAAGVTSFYDVDEEGLDLQPYFGNANCAVYGDGLVGEYTYNIDTNLDQDFVYYLFQVDQEVVALVVTHNGCDARGGFGTAHIFDADEGLGSFRVNIGCPDGCLRFDVEPSSSDFTNMEGYTATVRVVSNEQFNKEFGDWAAKVQAELAAFDAVQAGQLVIEGTPAPEHPAFDRDGIIIAEADGTATCPICGGKITGSIF